MRLWLVVNGFLINNKFNEIYTWLKKALEKYGNTVELKYNTELITDGVELLGECRLPDAVVFWDKDIMLARVLECKGIRLFNSSRAIELCDDKGKTYKELAQYAVPMPKTYIAPMTFRNIGYTSTDFIDRVAEEIGYPMVIKERSGSFGAQVYLASNSAEAYKICSATSEPVILQQYVAESSGRDIRLNMVGNRCVAAMERYNDSDFRANVTLGGSMRAYTPTEAEIELAAKACDYIGLDFGGVDILHSNNGPLLCEVNSNAHFKSIYDCTGVNVADEIAAYINEAM
jgi:RimK family alpha-L-glutamate ligase